MKDSVGWVLVRITLWIALAAAAGKVHAWVWSTGTPAPPHPAVVRIFALDTRGASLGTGTLVAVSTYHGLVITNWHVVRDAKGSVLVQFADGFASPATILKVDRDWDLAALAIWRPRAKPVPIAVDPPRPGEILTIAGYGQGDYRISYGPCTQYLAPHPHLPAEFVELRATARQGDSGGPIFNSRGELAGVLFGSGFRETMGAYCGRVRSFLMPLRDTFYNLPPPDPLLVQAAAAGAPQVNLSASGPSGSSANQVYGNPSPSGTVNAAMPTQVPLVASLQGSGLNTSSTTATQDKRDHGDSQDYLASAPSQLGNLGNANTVYLNSSFASQGWRESTTNESISSVSSERYGSDQYGAVANSQQAAASGTAGGDTSSYRSPCGTHLPDQTSGSSNIACNRSTESQSDEKTKIANGGYSGEYAGNRTNNSDFVASASEKTSTSGRSAWGSESKDVHTQGWGLSEAPDPDFESDPYSRGFGNSESDTRENDRLAAKKLAAKKKEDYYQTDTPTGNRTGYLSRSSGTLEASANNNDSVSSDDSFSHERATPPYASGFDRAGTTDFASQDYSQYDEDESALGYTGGSKPSQRQRRGSQSYTASINTRSTDSRQPVAASDGKQKDFDGSYAQTSLAETIPPKRNPPSSSTGSSSGYSPIPIYDGDGGQYESWTDKYSPASGHFSDPATIGSSRSDYSFGGSTTRTESKPGSPDSVNRSGRSDGSSEAVGASNSARNRLQQNRRPQDHSGSWSKTAEKDQNKTGNSESSFQVNSSADSTHYSRIGESSSSSSDYDETDDEQGAQSQSTGGQATGGQSEFSSASAAGGTASKPEAAGKATPGWETMIGVIGLLILFIQSMRWLSLLYDRSYYQRRRSYRPTRRRTVWSTTPPPSYRWYY
ncbi:MAG: S1 family peptidase [Thermogutta sp.]